MANGQPATVPGRPHVQEAWEGGGLPCEHNHFSPGVCELLNCLANQEGKRWQEIVLII